MATTHSKTDVLIVGAGPAGLMAAYWMARCGIKARIVDKRGHKVYNGHADGLRPRTQEIFDSMGGNLQQRIQAEGYVFDSFRTWVPDESGKISCIARQAMAKQHITELPSPFITSIISQGRIERFLLDSIAENSRSTLTVERGVAAESLVYDASLENDHEAYPIRVTLRGLSDAEANPAPANGGFGGRDILAKNNLPEDELAEFEAATARRAGGVETIEARYLIGADGAHSWVRHALEYKTQTLSGEDVIDIVPITDFPGICYSSFIESEHGTMIAMPRERNMTRLYVPFKLDSDGEHNTHDSIDLDAIRRRAQSFFKGYTFDFKVCEWWSVYKVGQRVAERASNPGNRIFLAGDALHMHSPKIGLGMNTSQQDGYNLGWKVALAASGALADPAALLATYQAERLPVANTLVKFDRMLWSPEGTVAPEAFLKTHEAFRQFSEGQRLMYPESPIVSKTASKQSAAKKLLVGESFIHARVVGHATSQLHWTTRLFASDGRFRIVLLAGGCDSEAQLDRVREFCSKLQKPTSEEHLPLLTRHCYPFNPPSRYSASGADPTGRQHPAITFEHERPLESMISLLAIHSGQDYASRTPFDFPKILRGPFDPGYHGWDYGRLFVDAAVNYDRYCDGRVYYMWGVDRGRGAVVVVRPDMHVGWVGELEDVGGLEGYFGAVFGR